MEVFLTLVIFWNFCQLWKGAWGGHVGDLWKPSKPGTRDRTKFHSGEKILGSNSQRLRYSQILNAFYIEYSSMALWQGIWCGGYTKYKVSCWNSLSPRKRWIGSEFKAECVYWGFQSASGLRRTEGRVLELLYRRHKHFKGNWRNLPPFENTLKERS